MALMTTYRQDASCVPVDWLWPLGPLEQSGIPELEKEKENFISIWCKAQSSGNKKDEIPKITAKQER